MMRVINCAWCNEHGVPMGRATVTLKVSSSRHCGQCRHGHEHVRSLWFCSAEHAVAYMLLHGNKLGEMAAELEGMP